MPVRLRHQYDCRVPVNGSWRLLVFSCWVSVTIVVNSSSVGAHDYNELRARTGMNEADQHGTAPKWPFHGIVSEAGVYWNAIDGSVSVVQLGEIEHCGRLNEPEVSYDEIFVYFANSVSSLQTSEAAGTYVVPWGDMAYPLMTNVAVTRKTIGQLPEQSVSNWRTARRVTVDTSQGLQTYGSGGIVEHRAFLGSTKSHLLHVIDEDVHHYVLNYEPNVTFMLDALSLDRIESDKVGDVVVQAEEYRLYQEEMERQRREDGDYDAHAGPVGLVGPRIFGINGSYVHWEVLPSGFSWCDRWQGFFLDATTGEFVGCLDGELLEILPSAPAIFADAWAAPLGFSIDECAGSLEIWKADPAGWFQRLEGLRLVGQELRQ